MCNIAQLTKFPSMVQIFTVVKTLIITWSLLIQERGDEKTVFEVETDKLSQLPIVDLAPRDWKEDAEFGFETGPLCFRWRSELN